MHNKKLITVLFLSFLLSGCTHNDIIIQSVLIDAGSNRSELEAVLNHYRTTDPAPQKLLAAKFLIKNLSAHYSYANTEIHEYYDYASLVLSEIITFDNTKYFFDDDVFLYCKMDKSYFQGGLRISFSEN